MMLRLWRGLMVVLLVVIAAAGCSDKLGFGSKGSSEPLDDDEEPGATLPPLATQPVPQRPVVIDMAGRPMSFAPLVLQADPSVGVVKAIQKEQVRGRERTTREGLGTAFVYDPAGYLLTNHHVIEKMTEITVGFADGRELIAKVVGSDKRTDVAVLKVDATNLPSLPLGDSEELLVGDWVVAIGNPFGLSHTVSAGILSAKGRSRDDVHGLDREGYFDFLQTDASINPGNSGGPLLNLKGEVVGINSAIRKDANNIGFAIPVNMVKELLPLLLRDGMVKRSAMGVIVDHVSLEQAKALGRPTTKGAWVKGVQGDGPADKGGIEVDDVIVAFNNKPIDDPDALRWHASIFGIGQTASVRVARGKKEIDLKVTLNALPQQSDD